jgi:hypothetical protein
MAGQFEWRYSYLGIANGSKDLFGDLKFQDSPQNNTGALIGFAGQNNWRGYNGDITHPMATSSWGNRLLVVRGGWSYADSDASYSDMRMTFFPKIAVNSAIAFGGTFDLAGTRAKYNHRDFQTNGPLDRWYQFDVSQNAFDTAMIPSINQWYLNIQLPYGVLNIGARDFSWGVGAAIGLNGTRNSSLMLILPYGPFKIIPWINLARNPDGFGPFAPYGGSTGPAANTIPDCDAGKHPSIFASLGMTYSNSFIDCGAATAYGQLHLSQANFAADYLSGQRVVYPNGPLGPPVVYGYGGVDVAILMNSCYFKFNDGRFFANLEYDWLNDDLFFLGEGKPITPNHYSGAPQLYTESSLAFVETGFNCGPAKIAAMFSWFGGRALNNGNATKAYAGIAINNRVITNYNYLLFLTYSGGNDAPWVAEMAWAVANQMADSAIFAARLDYAVAANLNVWSSYLWASRVEENGWLAGQKSSSGTAAVGTGVGGAWTVPDAQNWKHTAMPGAGVQSSMNPYVDDNFLGWELGLGADWKLLENMTFSSRYAYWQPGPWFDQAYQVIGQLPGGAATTKGFMQGRSAIQAFIGSILVDF